MTDAAWMAGLALLHQAGLPGWPTDPAESEARSNTLRTLTDELSDAEWLHACTEAAKRERWFPVPATLRDYASTYVSLARMLGPARGEAQRQLDRAECERGLALVKAAVAERAKLLPPAPTVSLPPDPHLAVRTDERMDELRRQAEAITEGA